MITSEGEEATEVVITTTSGLRAHARLVFRDPDPAPGVATDLWEAQAGRHRRYGNSAVEAAKNVMNAFQADRGSG